MRKNRKFYSIRKIYGYPFKSHKQWNVLVETDNKEITEVRFKKARSAKRFHAKYRRGL